MKKLLLDECVPKKLIRYFPEHEIKTVGQMKWNGKKNGELLSRAEQEFDVLITVDKNIKYQQNFINYQISLIVLDVTNTHLDSIIPLIEDIRGKVQEIQIHEIIIISED